MLLTVEWRKENKAIFDRLENLKKEIAEEAAGERRQLEILLQTIAAVKQEIQEIKVDRVPKQEWEAYKERERAREHMDEFYATGAMGGLSPL